jgi:hypothetical protein
MQLNRSNKPPYAFPRKSSFKTDEYDKQEY